jgi:hypothetical protein
MRARPKARDGTRDRRRRLEALGDARLRGAHRRLLATQPPAETARRRGRVAAPRRAMLVDDERARAAAQYLAAHPRSTSSPNARTDSKPSMHRRTRTGPVFSTSDAEADASRCLNSSRLTRSYSARRRVRAARAEVHASTTCSPFGRSASEALARVHEGAPRPLSVRAASRPRPGAAARRAGKAAERLIARRFEIPSSRCRRGPSRGAG